VHEEETGNAAAKSVMGFCFAIRNRKRGKQCRSSIYQHRADAAACGFARRFELVKRDGG
jgi:hypothetical protein